MRRRFLEGPMKFRFGFAGVLLGTGFLNSPAAYSQSSAEETLDKRSQSHVTIPLEGRDFNQALRNRFGRLRGQSEERDQWLKDAREAAAKLQVNGKDEEAIKTLKELAKNEHAEDWLKEELNALKSTVPQQGLQKLEEEKGFRDFEEAFRKLRGNRTGSSSNQEDTQGGKFGEAQGSANGGNSQERSSSQATSTSQGMKSSDESTREPYSAVRSSPPPPSKTESTFDEKLKTLVQGTLDANKGPLSESPAVQDALRQLRRSQFRANQAGQNDDAWANQFAHLSESLTKIEIWSKVNWPKLGKWQLPSPRSLPKLHSPWGAPSFEKMPRVSMPSASAIDRGMQLLWLAIIVAVGVVIWRLFGKSIPGMGRLGGRAWKLGPWPVAPSAVASGHDLILAFEHLSLLKLGPVAQSRNHLDLAVDLGQEEIANRRAAVHLASLYEQARYIPGEEPLSAEDLAAARTELSFLAGAKHA
jgi:hypothetical protein